MKKRNWIISTILASSILTVTAVGVANACGGPGGGFGGRGGGQKMMHMIDKLDLTKEQRTAVWNIMDEQRDAMRDNREQMFTLRKALRKAAVAENYDQAKVQELADKKASMMSNMVVQKTETLNRIRKLLTAEQLENFDKFQNRSFGRGHF